MENSNSEFHASCIIAASQIVQKIDRGNDKNYSWYLELVPFVAAQIAHRYEGEYERGRLPLDASHIE